MHTCLINGNVCLFIYQKVSTLSALIKPSRLLGLHIFNIFHFLCSDNYILTLSVYCPKQKYPPLEKFKPACLLIYVKSTTLPVYWALSVY